MAAQSPVDLGSTGNQEAVSSQSSPLSQSSKGPWTSLLLGKITSPAGYALEVEIVNDMAKANIPEEVLRSQPLWSSYIVGYFIGDAPHIGKVHATVNRIWTSGNRGTKIDVQFLNSKAVLFRVEDSEMRSRVLKKHYWHIGESPLVVEEWNPKATNLKPDLSTMPIWVDFAGVPDQLFSETGLKFLGDII
ncbi:hypothetical protein AALP_AAs46602U000100, partial [Arabis alpina]